MPVLDIEPFRPGSHPVTAPDPERDRLASTTPAALLRAPAGGPVLVVTDETLARSVLGDPRIVKDPAWAPADWDPQVAGLEPPAAAQASLTTLDGPEHTALRRAHAPLFTARRLRAEEGAVTATAREMLSRAAGSAADGEPVDLMADFTTRYPLTVVLDVLGIPRDEIDTEIDTAADGCRKVITGDFSGIASIAAVADAGLRAGANRATQLGERLPPGATRDDLRYHLFGMIFAGQLTTDAALGELLLAELTGGRDTDPEALVEQVLHRHPPAPYTLWRFTSQDVEIAGHRLPARTPVLVDLQTVCRAGASMAFGAGPHVCVGAQLARVELRAAVRVLRTDFPQARLAVETSELSRSTLGGNGGDRLDALPVLLR